MMDLGSSSSTEGMRHTINPGDKIERFEIFFSFKWHEYKTRLGDKKDKLGLPLPLQVA